MLCWQLWILSMASSLRCRYTGKHRYKKKPQQHFVSASSCYICHDFCLMFVSVGIRQCGLAQGASGSSATGFSEGTKYAKTCPLQPVRPAGHQRCHYPPESAGAQTGWTGQLKRKKKTEFLHTIWLRLYDSHTAHTVHRKEGPGYASATAHT